MKDKRIIFAGTPELSAHHLKELLQQKFDLIVIALSLSGINFIGEKLQKLKIKTLVRD